MARIRHIHPRAPQDEDVASMSIFARHLWDRLPCYADREGRLEDRPLMLKGEVFPADTIDVSKLIGEFVERGFVIRYVASNGRRQIQIVSWHDYQRPDHKERDSILEPPPGWTLDKRGKWMCDRTVGNEAVQRSTDDNGPGEKAVQRANDSIGTGRDCSGNPVIRYSGDPELSLPRDPGGAGTEAIAPSLAEAGRVISDAKRDGASLPSTSGLASEVAADLSAPPRWNGWSLLTTFGRLRREILELQSPPGTETPKDINGKASSFAEKLTEDEARDVEATMRLALTGIKASAVGWSDPRLSGGAFAFGSWCAQFSDLRAVVYKCAPQIVASVSAASGGRRSGAAPVVSRRKPQPLHVEKKTEPRVRGWPAAADPADAVGNLVDSIAADKGSS
jgi:hypothetical protein